MTYTATITSASLRLREGRIIAGLLLKGVSQLEWKQATLEQNVLQMESPESIRRISGLLRARLEPFGPDLWRLVHQGETVAATQAVLAGAIKNSRLLGDFMDLTLREQNALFAPKLEHRLWNDYIAGCRARDAAMPDWSHSTLNRLRSAVFSMLAQAGYLKDTRSLVLQNVFLDEELANILRHQGEDYVLRCLQVME